MVKKEHKLEKFRNSQKLSYSKEVYSKTNYKLVLNLGNVKSIQRKEMLIIVNPNIMFCYSNVSVKFLNQMK